MTEDVPNPSPDQRCTNPFCKDGQTEQGSCLRCGGTGRMPREALTTYLQNPLCVWCGRRSYEHTGLQSFCPTDALPTSNQQASPSDQRNGCYLDAAGCCKVCDGEIPYGHTENCDIWKLEMELNRLKSAKPPSPVETSPSDSEDAAKWRALRNCARVRIIGSAGMNDPISEVAHIGVEFWTRHPARSTAEAIETLERFVRIARGSAQETPDSREVLALRWLAESADPDKLTGWFAVDHARRALGLPPLERPSAPTPETLPS